MKQKFTIQIRGTVLADDQATLEAQMHEVLATFPQFNRIFSSIEVWADFSGAPKLYNEDGSVYTPTVEDVTTDKADDIEDVTQ